MRRSRRVFAISWLVAVSVVGTVIFISAGWVWSDESTIALQVVTWGLADPVWLLVNLLAAFLSGVTLNAGGGLPQLVIASLVTFAGVAILQLAVLSMVAKLLRVLSSRFRKNA